MKVQHHLGGVSSTMGLFVHWSHRGWRRSTFTSTGEKANANRPTPDQGQTMIIHHLTITKLISQTSTNNQTQNGVGLYSPIKIIINQDTLNIKKVWSPRALDKSQYRDWLHSWWYDVSRDNIT